MKVTKAELKRIIKEEIGGVLNERILDFEELINTVSAQVDAKTANKETLVRLIDALRQSQDPEQIKQLKILKNYVHHAVPESLPSAGHGEKSEFTQAETKMLQKWRKEYGPDLPPTWKSEMSTPEWYEQYIQTGQLK